MKNVLLDRFGRAHTNLRLSVTDRCNIRCFYCMPLDDVKFRPREELLTFEEIMRFVTVAVSCGIRSIRLTGGEPLVRAKMPQLIRLLRQIDLLDDIALTTNGILLSEQAAALKAAGLDRLNISLDTLNEQTFQKIARRDGLAQVLDGIAAAQDAGFANIRLNALAIRDLTEDEIVDLVHFARRRSMEMRFIEFMPLDAESRWQRDSILTGDEIRARIETEFGTLIPSERDNPAQPATDFQFADGHGKVGFINPVSRPFCDSCNRLRLTAEGQIRNCLFSIEEWDARALLRSGKDDHALRQLVIDCVAHKKAGHGIDDVDFVRPDRSMYQIGG